MSQGFIYTQGVTFPVQVNQGGTGTTSSTGTGSVVLSNTPAISSPTISTPTTTGFINGSSPSSGIVGETLSVQVLLAGAISIPNGGLATIASLTLTPGDWLVYGTGCARPNTGITTAGFWISTTVATVPDFSLMATVATNAVFGVTTLTVPPMRFSSASNTIIYLTGTATNISSGTCLGLGSIYAIRVR